MIDKIYFLNLDSKIERWNNLRKLKDLYLNDIERFPAINSVENPMIYKDYGLELNPVGFAHTLYFSSFYGAVGCYLSHYEMWKEIVKNKWENVLILEDDIHLKLLKKFLVKLEIGKGEYGDFLKKYDLVQLSCKRGFGGTEAYLLNYKAAEHLIKNTHNSSIFKNIIPAEINTNHFISKGYLKKDEWDWNVKNSIIAPVDKFIQYNVDCLQSMNKIKFKRSRKVYLDASLVFDSVIETDDSYFKKEWSKEKMEKFIKSEQYEWWKNK